MDFGEKQAKPIYEGIISEGYLKEKIFIVIFISTIISVYVMNNKINKQLEIVEKTLIEKEKINGTINC